MLLNWAKKTEWVNGLLDCNTGKNPMGLPLSEQSAEDIGEDKLKIISLGYILRKVTRKQAVIEID